jgi:hypothetical protein
MYTHTHTHTHTHTYKAHAAVWVQLLLYTYLEGSLVLGASNPAVAVGIQHIKRKLRASHALELGLGDVAIFVFVKMREPCLGFRV